MNKSRKQRFETVDLRELEELVWRDLKAVGRAAASERAEVDRTWPERPASRRPEAAADHADGRTTPAEVGPDNGNSQAPMASEETAAESTPSDSDSDNAPGEFSLADTAESTGSAPDENEAPAGREWSDRHDEEFLDGVVEWLRHQAHPDEMMAEIWCRLLARRAEGSAGPETPAASRRLQ